MKRVYNETFFFGYLFGRRNIDQNNKEHRYVVVSGELKVLNAKVTSNEQLGIGLGWMRWCGYSFGYGYQTFRVDLFADANYHCVCAYAGAILQINFALIRICNRKQQQQQKKEWIDIDWKWEVDNRRIKLFNCIKTIQFNSCNWYDQLLLPLLPFSIDSFFSCVN